MKTKSIFKYIGVLAAMASLASCTSETPFFSEGEGVVRMNVVVNPSLTRASLQGDYGEYLADNCRIYVSDDKGVIHKWVGVDNLPRNGVSLRYGSYKLEAFSGDSVSASFDDMYFKGVKDFVVNALTPSVQVNLTCNIANVVTILDSSTVDPAFISNLKVEISNKRGKLTFEGDKLYNRGYFMMPQGISSLSYVLDGVDNMGNPVHKEGAIENVKPAHEYILKLKYAGAKPDQGGAFISVVVSEREILVEDEVVIHGRPAFSWVDDDPKVDRQIINTTNSFTPHVLRAVAYGGFCSLMLKTDNQVVKDVLGDYSIELYNMTESYLSKLESKGIRVTTSEVVDGVHRYYILFDENFLNGLPKSDNEYVIDVYAEDISGKSSVTKVRIANTEKAIKYDDPIVIDISALSNDLTAVRSNSVTIPMTLTNPDVENASVQYRVAGSSSWVTVPVTTRAVYAEYDSNAKTLTISGLSPNTSYELRAVAGEFVDGSYSFESEISTFTTESVFSLKEASFEDWSTYNAQTTLGKKNVILPSATGDKMTAFWGSGNEGSATANMTLTDKSTDMVHSGTYSARLESKSALGIIAAGNLFVGYYDRTDGTNGVLQLGREYDGSHPSAVRLYANYRPGSNVSVKSGNEGYIDDMKKGGTDQGQIYIALIDEVYEVRTNPKKRKLFDKNDEHVLAYGQVTWKEAFGPDGQLQLLEIPFEYNERAKTKRPTHVVIVCSASKFGDYFSGASGSVMYVDDFELVY